LLERKGPPETGNNGALMREATTLNRPEVLVTSTEGILLKSGPHHIHRIGSLRRWILRRVMRRAVRHSQNRGVLKRPFSWCKIRGCTRGTCQTKPDTNTSPTSLTPKTNHIGTGSWVFDPHGSRGFKGIVENRGDRTEDAYWIDDEGNHPMHSRDDRKKCGPERKKKTR